jgi:hypothetical protein
VTTKQCYAKVYYQPNCIVSGLRDRAVYRVTTQAHNRFGYSVPSDPEWVIPAAPWRLAAVVATPVVSSSHPVVVQVTGIIANAEGIYPQSWVAVHFGPQTYYCQPSPFGLCLITVHNPDVGRTKVYADYTGYGVSYASPVSYVTVMP